MTQRILTLPVRAGALTARLGWDLTSRAVKLAVGALGLRPAPRTHPSPAGFDPRPTEPAPRPTEPDPRPTEPAPRPTEPAPRPTEPDPRPTERAPRPTEPEPRQAAQRPAEQRPAEPPPAEQRQAEPRPAAENEPELVAESADRGAEDGAGAAVAIEPPWEGYAAMNAGAVIDRLAVATAAQLALVELYERAHRNRPTVLAAAHKRLTEPPGA